MIMRCQVYSDQKNIDAYTQRFDYLRLFYELSENSKLPNYIV